MNFGLPANLDGMDGLIVLVVVVVVLFGSRQIPKLARSLGSAQKEFKKGLDEGASETSDGTEAGKASPAVTQTVPPAAVNPPAQTTVTVETNGDGSSGSSS